MLDLESLIQHFRECGRLHAFKQRVEHIATGRQARFFARRAEVVPA